MNFNKNKHKMYEFEIRNIGGSDVYYKRKIGDKFWLFSTKEEFELNKNIMEKKYSESDIEKGADIEMEHAVTIKKFMRNGVTVREVARAIAIDHLEESPTYYEDLKEEYARGGSVKKENLARIHCHNPKCNWSWKVKDGGDDLYICHKCYTDNEKFYVKGGSLENDFEIEENEDGDRITISLKGIGEVILVQTSPQYEFIEDIDEDTLEELNVSEYDMIGKIEHLEVNDKFKGKGYAKSLMNKAIEIAEEYGWMPLYLNASPMGSKRYGLNIEDLTGFYETFGFKVFLEQGNNNLMLLNEKENFSKGGLSVDYSFYSGRGRRRGDEKKPEIFFIISNSIVGDLKLGNVFATSIENEYETKTFLDVFHSYKDCNNKLFEYLSSKESEYLLEKPNSDFIIEEMTYDGKSMNEDGSPLINKKTVYKISAKKVKELKSKYRFKDGGDTNENFLKGGLIAPNGEPSNLTPKQYKLVRSKEFISWFGDWENYPKNSSKVIDKNGEPLVCYHGTDNEFYEFDINKQRIGWLGKGFYFSENKIEAKDYGKRLLKVFLNIKNPFIIQGDIPNEDGTVKWALNREGQISERYSEVNASDISTTLKKFNNDGIIEGSMISCFYPNQIKLADGTNTTFDSDNPDIRFDDGGRINKDFKYSLTFGGITIYTNTEQEYVGKKYSPFESKGSFKASVRKIDLENIAIESEQLKNFNFQWGVDDWKSISQKLKNKGINKLELYLTSGIIKNYELKILSDLENPDIRFEDGGEVEDLISQGIVELKMFATKPEHAKEYGLDSINPLYVQSLYVNENDRLKGVGNKVLKYIDDYAIKKGHDVVFGHITQNAKFTKDLTETDSSDIDLIKSFLRKNGYETIESNNDFYKIIAKSNSEISFDNGGEIADDKLVALHNISAGQIISANELGGLVTPSIAILKAGQKFTDFGDITLIPNKELINPKNSSIKVFAGDVYSPTVPRKLFNFDKKKLDKESIRIVHKSYTYDEGKYVYHIIQNLLSDYNEFYKDLGRMSYEELVKYYFDKFYLAYLVDQDIKIPIPTKDKANYLWNNFDFTLNSEQKNRFKPILDRYLKERNEKSRSDIDEKIKSDVYDLFVEVKNNELEKIKQEENEEYYNFLKERLNETFEKEVGTRYKWYEHYFNKLLDAVGSKKVLDEKKLKENIDKYFTKSKKEDYKNWLENFIYQFLGSEYFLQGNKKLDYNLDNLVDATTGKLVGAEKNLTFGVNQAKSFATKQLKSLDEIKNKSNILITKEEMNVVDESNKEKFNELRDALTYEFNDTWSSLDSLGKALADYYKGSSVESALRKNDYKAPNDYQKDLFLKIAEEIKNSPVDYFEAKLQRAVKLNEFDYAIVPFDTDKKVLEILKSNGIKIKKYKTKEERVNETNSIVFKDKKLTFKEGGMINENKNTIFVNSKEGKIPVKLERYWQDDTELVPIKELIEIREFNRLERPKYNLDDSKSNINTLESIILKEGITEPLIIEYSLEDNAVLLIEGNHRLNVAINLGFDYFPARVVLRRREFPSHQQDKAKKVKGVKPDEYGYVRSNLKPSQVGIKGTVKAFEQGGIIEGQLHSECNPETGCGEKFDVGGVGHIIEAERDEAVIVSKAFEDNNEYEIKGSPSEIASALNVIGGGKNFDSGAVIKKEDGEQIKVSEIKEEAKNTDVESIDPSSIIINRRSMYDDNEYVAEGTPKQIASQINNLNNNGVKITDGGSIKKA